MERGWVQVKEAYRREDALRAQQVLWQHLEERGVLKDDPSTWQPMVRMNEGYSTEEFARCDTERFTQAIEDLVGADRMRNRHVNTWGWWPVNFALGADRPWDVPANGWHWDGSHFRHYVDSPEQGVLILCMFSEIGRHAGGTVVVEGSHNVVAKYLATQPDGVVHRDGINAVNEAHPFFRRLTGMDPIDTKTRMETFMDQEFVDDDGFHLRVAEVTASPGDVVICHPFLYHASAQNLSGIPRFMCNRTAALKERMRIRGEYADDELSVVERTIRRALAPSA